MNILILVGIFLLALIAIVAVVLLVMGERETEASAGNSALMKPVALPAVNDESVRTGAGGEVGRSEKPGKPGKSSTAISSLPLMEAEAQEETERSDLSDLGNLDGQFHELSVELRALHARTQEMEQRISMLMEIVDRLEHDHGGLLDLGIDSEG